jgi:hypothetical protein
MCGVWKGNRVRHIPDIDEVPMWLYSSDETDKSKWKIIG